MFFLVAYAHLCYQRADLVASLPGTPLHSSIRSGPMPKERTASCKWCGRNRNEVRGWRRERGRECSDCPRFLQKQAGEWSALFKEDKKKLESDLESQPGKRAKYRQDLKEYLNVGTEGNEASENESGDENDLGSYDASVMSKSTSNLTLKRKLGYFWSLKLLKQHKKKVPGKSMLTTLPIHGEMVKGVILSEEHGTPVGVREVWDESGSSFESSATIAKQSDVGSKEFRTVATNRQGR